MEYFFADGAQQHGPHTLEQLASMGLKPETLVWRDGLPEWQQARMLPELASLFAASPRPVQHSASAVAPAPLAALPYQPSGTASGNPNGMAIASLVLGIVSLVTFLCYFFGFIPGILAIIFGVMARRQIRQSDGQGYGMATAGLICGSIAVGLIVLGLTAIVIAYAVHN
jgi:hypothetical protein